MDAGGELVAIDAVGCKRGRSAEGTDEHKRFTVQLWSSADGVICPSFSIIKCSSTKHDLTSTRVVQTLHTEKGFTAADGWTLRFWSRTMDIKRNGNMVTETHKRPYIEHTDGSIITCQSKAYMDTCVDLQCARTPPLAHPSPSQPWHGYVARDTGGPVVSPQQPPCAARG